MKLDHIAMYVTDLESAKNFFQTYFNAVSNDGYHNQTTNFRSYFLQFEDGARLELMHRPDMENLPKSPVRTGYVHIAFSVGSKENVIALTQRLKADGYTLLSGPRTTGDGYFESCMVGIENNVIEITV